MTEEQSKSGGQTEANPVEVECPKCHHKFWHTIKTGLKDAAAGLGNAIGESMFGGNR